MTGRRSQQLDLPPAKLTFDDLDLRRRPSTTSRAASRLLWQSCRSRFFADVQAPAKCPIPPKSRSASSRNTSSWCCCGLPNKTLHRHLGDTQRRTCIRSFERLRLSYSSIQILLDVSRAPNSRSFFGRTPGNVNLVLPPRQSLWISR